MALIALEGLHFFGYHGLYAEEQAEGNTFIVDIWLDTGNAPLPLTDNVNDTLDYSVAYQIVAAAMAQRANLLETLVGRCGDALLARFPSLVGVRVRVSKLDPPLGGECYSAYVENEFRR